MPKFNGSEGSYITLKNAKDMTENYRNSPIFPLNNNIKGFFLGKQKLDEILKQKNCKGIRIYYGLDMDGNVSIPQIVAVGVDENKNDMVAGGKILDFALPCPSECPTVSSGLD